MKLLTTEQALSALARAVQRAGSQQALAAQLDISPAYLSDVLRRRRDPAHVLRKIGLYRRVMFSRTPERS